MQKFNFDKIMSGLLLTLLLVTIVSFTGQVNAQAPPDMSQMPGAPKMISAGTYSNSDYGVQLTIPDGWQGMEMQGTGAGMGLTVVISKNFENSDSQTGGTAISLYVMPAVTSTNNPVIPQDSQTKCNVISSDNTNVNGMSATENVIQCTSPDLDSKMKSYMFKTDKNVVFMTYNVFPSSRYDENVATFDSVVKTLQIANTVDVSSTSPTTSDATVPEFPTIASLILAVSIFTIIGFTMISRKNHLPLFGRN